MLHPYFSLTCAAACWGTGTVVSKHALEYFDAVPLIVVQLTISAVALWATALLQNTRRGRAGDRARVESPHNSGLKAASLGVLNPGLAYALGLAGLATIAATTSVVLWASEPALIAAE